MSEAHLMETELAYLSDGESGAEVAAHLRWCARCRSVAADYCWLQGEIETALATVAEAVPVPGSRWWAVQARLFAGRRRQIAGWRVSAFASVVLAVSLMLSAPSFLTPAVVALGEQPGAATVPAPVTAFAAGESVATPTPVISCADEALPPPTPAVVLPPTPPQPEA